MRFTKPLWAPGALLVLGLLVLSGCSGSPQPDPRGKNGGDQGHPEQGPHEGALAEWGDEEYHVEFTVDHPGRQATVYVLDGSAKKAAPIKAESITLKITNVTPPATVTLKAEPQEGDSAGSSSRFTGTHEALGKVMEFKGEISGTVGDTPYTGTFEEKPHGHAGGHATKGRHGGVLFAEPNHKYHLELVPTSKSGEKAYLYLLDGDAKKAVPTKAQTLKLTYKSEPPVTVEFKAEPQKDDAAGTSSRFTAPAAELPKDFDHDKASISGEVGGKPYVFEPE